MIRQILLLFLHVWMAHGCSTTTLNQIQTADFEILTATDYVPSRSYNFIGNITKKSVQSVVECAQECTQYAMCETATFYVAAQTCSLYKEKYGLGQVVTVDAQTASTITLNTRNPTVIYCVPANEGIILYANQFIYSSNQLFAFGIATPSWGIFHTYPNGSIGSNYWQPAGNIPPGYFWLFQGDGNVVLYAAFGSPAWALGGTHAGSGPPYTFYVSNTGKLVWIDQSNQVALEMP